MKPVATDRMMHHHQYSYFKREIDRRERLRIEEPDSPGWIWFVVGSVCGAILIALTVLR